jgi:hypothetical protein
MGWPVIPFFAMGVAKSTPKSQTQNKKVKNKFVWPGVYSQLRVVSATLGKK